MNEDVNQVDCLRESSPTSMFECTRKIILNSIWQFLVLNEDSKFNHNNNNFVETFNLQSLRQSLLVVVMQWWQLFRCSANNIIFVNFYKSST